MVINKLNDIDPKNWKLYPEINTDSLWLFNAKGETDTGTFQGCFIPQIVEQMFWRWTKRGNGPVLDCFIGSGTSAYVAEHFGHKIIGIDLVERFDPAKYKNLTFIKGDAVDPATYADIPAKSIQFAIVHPPYHDIVDFEAGRGDLSHCQSVDKFLESMCNVFLNVEPRLKHGAWMALVIGDIYKKGEWIQLGFRCCQEAQLARFTLKNTIVKNMENNEAKKRQASLWRWRHLFNGTCEFKHEYIFVFKKD